MTALDLDSPVASPPDPGSPHPSGGERRRVRTRGWFPDWTRASCRNARNASFGLIGSSPAGILVALASACLLWSYWPPLAEMAHRWLHDPRYSHGFLVPPFALYLLWTRRQLRSDPVGSRWFGVIPIATACALRWFGAYGYFSWFEAISLLFCLAGLSWLWDGWVALRRAVPAIAFLIFMVPLPYRLETALGWPLQRIATQVSTFVLQCCGLPAFRFGQTIVIQEFRIGVVDACNGLGICYMFLALAVAAAFVVHRPLLDKLLLVASAVPIALLSNVSRITACGLLHELLGTRVATAVYHDLAGWLMMLLTLAILLLECRFFSALFIEIDGTVGIPVEPRKGDAIGGKPVVSLGKTWRAIPLLVGIALVVASGIVDGLLTNRWQVSQQLRLAVSRLDRVPLAIGDWRGRAEPIDPRAMTAAELEGCLTRRYENIRTGRTINLVLVCGRPGPVSVHSPEVCYPSAGFEMVGGRPARVAVPGDRRRKPAEFLRADFDQERSFPSERLRIAWSWKGTGPWSVPTYPRVTFAPQSFLYKLYLVYRPGGAKERAEDDSFSDFLRQLLPELDQALAPDSGASPERSGPHEAGLTASAM